MANKIRGILSEVVLEQALNDAIRQSGIKGKVAGTLSPSK